MRSGPSHGFLHLELRASLLGMVLVLHSRKVDGFGSHWGLILVTETLTSFSTENFQLQRCLLIITYFTCPAHVGSTSEQYTLKQCSITQIGRPHPKVKHMRKSSQILPFFPFSFSKDHIHFHSSIPQFGGEGLFLFLSPPFFFFVFYLFFVFNIIFSFLSFHMLF